MADKKVVLEAEIKSNIGEVSKETKELTNEFGVFGVTIGGIKDKFKDVAKIMNNGLKQIVLQAQLAGVGFKKMFSGDIRGGAKTLFTVIKTGIAATGIGALVVAFASLLTYFTQTKKGSELMKRSMAGLGAVVKSLTNVVSGVGEALFNAFTNPKQAIEDLWEGIKTNLMNRLTGIIDGFKAVGKVIKGVFTLDWDAVAEGAKEYGHAIVQIATGYDTESQEEFLKNLMLIDDALGKTFSAEVERTAALQRLTDAQRELNVETAQSIAWIEKQKLIAEDITKTYEEREAAATKAFNKEQALEAERIKLAEEAVRLEEERHEMLGEDGKLAEDLDRLADLEINLANIRQESAGRQISLQNFLNGLRQQEQAEKDAAREKEIADDDAMWAKKIADNDKWNEEQQKSRDKNTAADKKAAAAEQLIADKLEDTKKKTLEMGAAAAMKIAGEGSAVGKSVAVAMAIMNTKEAITNALGMKPYGPWNIAQAVATGVFGMAQVRDILATPIPGGGGGSSGSIGAAPAPPAPQMMSGAFELTGGVEPDPIQAFVLTDDMTNSQNQLANIRRRATI